MTCTTQILVVLLRLVERKFPRGTTNQKHYQDLGSAHVISIEFLRAILIRPFVRAQVATSQNVGCFLRLPLRLSKH